MRYLLGHDAAIHDSAVGKADRQPLAVRRTGTGGCDLVGLEEAKLLDLREEVAGTNEADGLDELQGLEVDGKLWLLIHCCRS